VSCKLLCHFYSELSRSFHLWVVCVVVEILLRKTLLYSMHREQYLLPVSTLQAVRDNDFYLAVGPVCFLIRSGCHKMDVTVSDFCPGCFISTIAK